MHAQDKRTVITEFDRKRLEGLLTVLRRRAGPDAARLAELEEELDDAHVVEPREIPANVVTMNSVVLLSDLESGEQQEVTLVFPGAAETNTGRISVLAPIGMALLGCRELEELSWPTPSRIRRVRIERVLYQPEAAGNFNL